MLSGWSEKLGDNKLGKKSQFLEWFKRNKMFWHSYFSEAVIRGNITGLV